MADLVQRWMTRVQSSTGRQLPSTETTFFLFEDVNVVAGKAASRCGRGRGEGATPCIGPGRGVWTTHRCCVYQPCTAHPAEIAVSVAEVWIYTLPLPLTSQAHHVPRQNSPVKRLSRGSRSPTSQASPVNLSILASGLIPSHIISSQPVAARVSVRTHTLTYNNSATPHQA